MPDITMCSGEGCSLRDGCYRFTARPSLRQAWFVKPPVERSDGVERCHYRMVVEKAG
jgi:hypothetical protein